MFVCVCVCVCVRVRACVRACVRVERGRPALFIGPTGTGKSCYVQQKLMNDLSHDEYLPTFVNFSAQTSANQTQVTILYFYYRSEQPWLFHLDLFSTTNV